MSLQAFIEQQKAKATIVSGNNTRYDSAFLKAILVEQGLIVEVTDGESRHDFDTFKVSNGVETIEFQF
jgi:hypothetical protein